MATFPYDDTDTAQKALVDRLRVVLDEVTVEGQTATGTSGARLYQQLVEAMRTVLTLAVARPALRRRVFSVATDGSSSATVSAESNHLRIEAPSDLIEWVRIDLPSWTAHVAKPSERVIGDTARTYETIQIPHAAPQPSRPIVAEVPDAGLDSGLALECYPVGGDTAVSAFDYIGTARPETMPVLLEEVLLWEAASAVLQSRRRAQEAAQLAYRKARQLLGERATSLRQGRPTMATEEDSDS